MSTSEKKLAEFSKEYMHDLLLTDIQKQTFILICDNAGIKDIEKLQD